MSAEELRSIFALIESNFQKGVLDRAITYYFSLGDGPGEKWTVTLGPERCEVREGKHTDAADCVVKTSSKLLLQMVSKGYVPTATDFMLGRIKSNNPFLLQDLAKAVGLSK